MPRPKDMNWLLSQVRRETAALSLSLEEQEQYRDGTDEILESCKRIVDFLGHIRHAAVKRQQQYDEERVCHLRVPEKRKVAVVLPGSFPPM